jgi:regulatory protein
MSARNRSSNLGYQSCLDAASRYLGYRPRSVFEVRTRLRQRGFDHPTIERVLQELGRNGSLDDLAFARFWRENRDSFSPRGTTLLSRELKSKGIAPHIVLEVLQGVDEEANAYRAAGKRARRLAGPDFNCFQSTLTSFLRRRGFSYDVVEHTVNQLWQEVHDAYA